MAISQPSKVEAVPEPKRLTTALSRVFGPKSGFRVTSAPSAAVNYWLPRTPHARFSVLQKTRGNYGI